MVMLQIKDQKIADKQTIILRLLYDQPRRQNELQQILEISAPALLYHLSHLEKQQLIKKTTLMQIGNAKVNEISLNPLARQRIRAIIGYEGERCTLITGFGKLDTGYRVPDISCRLLESEGFPINRLVCFSSEDAKAIREEQQSSESLRSVDQYYLFPYQDYRNFESEFFGQVENILQQEMQLADIILDLTPLSKIYSFKILEIANWSHLPCFYLGQDAGENYFLIWMSHLQLNGGLKN
jgi:DNA-binding PadR family transcriptional regulator